MRRSSMPRLDDVEPRMDSVKLTTRKSFVTIYFFVVLMIGVIAIQGTYLGYTVGVLTTLEKRFGISSEKSGSLLSIYDVGHTISILLVGYFSAKQHLARITGIGVILSAFSMYLLALPVLLFGTVSYDEEQLRRNDELYKLRNLCGGGFEELAKLGATGECSREHEEHEAAYMFLAFGQFVAGVMAAPFNTLAYVYIDDNVEDRRQSPFLLGLLTSMYAFGPALGFALSAGLTRVYTTLGEAPHDLTMEDDEWIGAWWLGYLLCGTSYLFISIPFFFFPLSFKNVDTMGQEMQPLNHHKPHLPPANFQDEESQQTCSEKFIQSLREFPFVIWDLMRNPIFISMVIGWMFGSYLIGGFSTYLPKYIETQYGQSASAADFAAGIISIASVATSTAFGGWLLTRLDIAPRRAILCLLGSWVIITITYLLGMATGCEQTRIVGLYHNEHIGRYQFIEPKFDERSNCARHCDCQHVYSYNPVNFDGYNYFSPCHAGCTNYDNFNQWTDCACTNYNAINKGLQHPQCEVSMYLYLIILFVGLFAGNLFFMVTMMIVLRSVYDDQKVMALSVASCITNVFGFIPAPILFGWVIDEACILWHSRCPDRGNCVVYDNDAFRMNFHLSNAGLQFAAVIAVAICYILSRNRKLPEEEDGTYCNDPEND